MADGVSSSPGRGTRRSRNAACTRCRTSKVRCNPSSIAGQPCQRCAKLQLPCVVDPTYRRTTRKSQLDQLASEVQAIKETVDSNTRQPLQTSSSPTPWPQRVQCTNEVSPPSATAVATQPTLSTAASEYNSGGHGDNNIIVDDTAVDSARVSSLPRALNSQPFTGPEIDEYFDIYFRHSHPHFPILSERDPNKCYDTSPFLFWAVVLISYRRQPTQSNPAVIRLLTEYIKHETDATVPKVPQPLPQLHAILVVAAWGLYPGVRFSNDPAYWLSGIAIHSCLLLGFHTGSGRHHAYSHVTLAASSSSREATVAWAASSILNRRMSTNLGVPCTAPINRAMMNMIHDEGSILPISFRVQLECQVFMDRVNQTMASSLEDSNGVPCELIRMFEDEWAAARARIIARYTDPVLSLHALFVLFEVQLYYFLPIPTQNSQSSTDTTSSASGSENLSPSIEADILRCYTTASTIITRAMDLDESTSLLHYLPHYIIRPIAHAIGIIFRVIRSDLPLRYPQIVVPEEATKISAHTIAVAHRISAIEGDLAWRLARCVELWHTTSAPYLAAAAAAVATSSSNAATGHDDENDKSDQAALADAGLDYEPILVGMFRQRMVAALGFDSIFRLKNKYGPVHMGPYGPPSQSQNLRMQVPDRGAGSHAEHPQALSAHPSGTGGPDNQCQSTSLGRGGGSTGLQGAQQSQPYFQSQQQQQQAGMQANVGGSTMRPGETGLPLPSVGGMDTDTLLGTDWGFLDDFGWGFDLQAI